MDSDDSEDVFEIPLLQYLNVKKDFLDVFLNPAALGNCNTRDGPDLSTRGKSSRLKQTILAFSRFIQYLKETSELAKQHPEHLENLISSDNMNLVFHMFLPLPRDLRGELLEKIFRNDEGKYDKNQPVKVAVAKMEVFIERKKEMYLYACQHQVLNEVNDISSYSANLLGY